MMKAKMVQMTEKQLDMDALREAGEILKRGGLVAFPTETVYGLGGNALDPEPPEKYMRRREGPLIIP